MAGVRGKDRGKREKRPCLTGDESETRKKTYLDKRVTKEKNARGAFIACLASVPNEKSKDDNQNDEPVHVDGDGSNDDTAQPGNLKSAEDPEAANTTMDTADDDDDEKACIFADTPLEVRNLMNTSCDRQ